MSALLGPEMGAPILRTPGKNAFFLQEKPMSTKFLLLGGGVFWILGGGGSADFIFMGAGIFLSVIAVMSHPVLQHRHVNFLTSRASPFSLCFHFSFCHSGFLYKTTRIHQESQRSDVATGNAGWPTQTQTQTQRCGALSTPSAKNHFKKCNAIHSF